MFQALELNQQLKSKKSSTFDLSAKVVRDQIRDIYEFILLRDHDFSDSHNIEDHLWRLHYKCIEDFRAVIRRLTSAQNSPAKSTSQKTSTPVPNPQTQLQKIQTSFKTFLGEASGFYHDLCTKLRAQHGLPPDYPFLEASSLDPKPLHQCRISVQRCLVALGDFARYRELHSEVSKGSGSRDWRTAAQYYQQAASIWPENGQPHNGLAVLALYSEDSLLALYRYIRSLAAQIPFVTTRENLLSLFEQVNFTPPFSQGSGLPGSSFPL